MNETHADRPFTLRFLKSEKQLSEFRRFAELEHAWQRAVGDFEDWREQPLELARARSITPGVFLGTAGTPQPAAN